jgi:hypothetical protein
MKIRSDLSVLARFSLIGAFVITARRWLSGWLPRRLENGVNLEDGGNLFPQNSMMRSLRWSTWPLVQQATFDPFH